MKYYTFIKHTGLERNGWEKYDQVWWNEQGNGRGESRERERGEGRRGKWERKRGGGRRRKREIG